MKLHIETPLIESVTIGKHTANQVWLKMEALQPAGSFKIRGIGHACNEYARRGARRFISSSGGNAGLAAAYAGRRLGIPVTVVVPETTTEQAKTLIRLEAAEVIVHGQSWKDANLYAQSLLSATNAFIHPFDDPLLWEGHATMIDEVANAGIKPDLVVLSVGGGGLLAGVVQGLVRNGWQDTPILAMETEGADSFAQSISAGRLIELEAIRSVATSLGARQVCEQAFNLYSRHPITSVVVTDKSAVEACIAFADNQRVIVERACGAALAAAYDRLPAFINARNVLVIVCGGVGVSITQLQHWRDTL